MTEYGLLVRPLVLRQGRALLVQLPLAAPEPHQRRAVTSGVAVHTYRPQHT